MLFVFLLQADVFQSRGGMMNWFLMVGGMCFLPGFDF